MPTTLPVIINLCPDVFAPSGPAPAHDRGDRPHSGRLPFRRVAALLCALAGAIAMRAQDWSPNLTVTSTWQDNATNAKPAADRIGALEFEADMIAANRYSLGRDDALTPAAHFAAEWWPRFNGLGRAAAGARLEWRHTFGVGALAPVFSVEGGGDAVVAKETGRRGTSVIVLATLRKRFNDVAQLTLTQELSDFNARQSVYDRKRAETALEFGRDITEVARVIVRVSYGDGDFLTHATAPRADLETLTGKSAAVATFGRPLTAYSLEARTIGGKLALIRAIDKTSAVIAGYEVRRTERVPFHFWNQLVAVAVVHQF